LPFPRDLRLFAITLTLLSDIAAAATIGERSRPKAG
jgi:hypothetical protein